MLPAMDSDRVTPTPDCPSCGNPMRFARAIPQAGGLPALHTYDCRECGVAMIEAENSQLAASDRAPIIGALLNHGLLVSTPEPQPVPNMDQRGAASCRRRSGVAVSGGIVAERRGAARRDD